MKLKSRIKNGIITLIIGACLLIAAMTGNKIKALATEEYQQAITLAQNWLQSERQTDGSWSTGKRTLMDTMTILENMDEYMADQISYLDSVQLKNNQDRSMWLSLIDEDIARTVQLGHLINSQNSNGGWGLEDSYQSNILDTITVIDTLINEENIDDNIIKKGLYYILSKQEADGSWTVNSSEDMKVGVTARSLILLDKIQELKIPGNDNKITTAISKGAIYLLSQKDQISYWGFDEDGIRSAKAIMIAKGLESVVGLDIALLSNQEANGSWQNKPGLTAMIIDWLRCNGEAQSTVIESVILKKVDETTNSFYADEIITIETISNFNTDHAEIKYYLKSDDGIVSELEGSFFNTGSLATGTYELIVKIRDKSEGIVLASMSVNLTIEPTFKLKT
jgi:prenyltransferase beta subunit